jgi:hypothetical protein
MTTLPKLPSRLEAATLTAADNLAAIAAAEGIRLAGERGEVLPHLITMLYFIRERCAQAPARPAPSLIEPAEIAAVLETIAHQMVGEGLKDLAGHNASWFKDAAAVVEQWEFVKEKMNYE